MGEPVNIGGKIPGSGMTNAQLDKVLNRIDAALGNKNNGGNAAGGVTNVTINQTINNTNNTTSNDNPFDKFGWQFARASWLGDDSASRGNSEESFKTLASEMSKLSASLEGIQRTVDDFARLNDIKKNIEKGYNGDSIDDYISTVRTMNMAVKDPQAMLRGLTAAIDDAEEQFKKFGGRHYIDNEGNGLVPAARRFDATAKYQREVLKEVEEELSDGRTTLAINTLLKARKDIINLPHMLQDAAYDIDVKERMKMRDAVKRGNMDYVGGLTAPEKLAIQEQIVRRNGARGLVESTKANEEAVNEFAEKRNEELAKTANDLSAAAKETKRAAEDKAAADKQAAEAQRQAAEQKAQADRQATETQKQLAEAERQKAETERQKAEADRRADEAHKKVEEEQAKFRQEVADIEKSTAEAQKAAAERRAQAQVAPMSPAPSSPPIPPNGGGSTPPNIPPNNNGIRYFESLTELTEYLNNIGTGELRSVSAEIRSILESLNGLDPEAKNISAMFDNDGTLRGIGLSAVSKKYGSAEVARMQYSFGLKPVDPEDEDSPTFYTVNRAQTHTQTFTDKIAKYQADLEAREQALITKLTAMRNLPIMQGDSSTNGLLKQWEEIARIGADGGVELIKKGSLADIEEAENGYASLKDSVKAINDLVTKKWANNSIEKMNENVEEMESMRKTLPNMFSKIGITSGDLFKEFDEAATRFHQAVDPKDQALAYNEMAKAIRTVKKTLTEENSAYNENIRLAKQQQKISHSSKVTLAGYKEKYDKMGDGRPEQYKKARDAKRRYDNAKDATEREAAYRDYEQNMNWMKDDLAVAYPKWKEKEKRSAKLKKDNSTRYWNGKKQTQQINNVRKELAEIAQPYGGLSADDLPDFITDVLKQITAAQNEKDPSVKAKRVSSLKDALKLAKESNKQVNDIQEANGLLEKIANTDSLADTEVHNNLQDALYRVTTLSQSSSSVEQADAWANLTANIKAASEALKEYDKAQTDSKKEATAQERLNTSYEQYLAQINTIKTAYEKMGKTIDTSKLEGEGGLLEQLMGTDVNDKNAVAEAQAKIRQELTRLRVQRQRDTAIFSADTRRDTKTASLNKWIEGLGIEDVQLDKIKSLKTLLEDLGNIDLNKSGGLEQFSNVMSQITETERVARMQVDTMQRYRRVTGDKDMELIDNGHLTEKQKTEGDTRRKALTEAYNTFNSAQGDVEAFRKLNDELRQMEAYLANVSKWDAFGKLGEQVTNYMGQLDLMKQKQGDVSKWKPGQQQMYNEMHELQRKYNTQVDAGDMTGAADSASKLENHIKALNQSFASGGGFVGIYEGKITKLATRLLGLGSGFMAFNKVLGTMRKMAGYVTQIDTAMTELRKVTDESSAAYTRFQKQSGQTAVQIGSSISDLINTSVEYGRMGYSLAESQQLGVVTTKFANTGNFNSVTDASDALIAIIRGFDGLDVSDAEMVSDKLTAVANAYAVTASDIATGLQRSASALNMGGVNLDQATAMITAISEITRDSASAGNAIKTLSMRVRGAKTELESAGEDTTGMAESTSKLRAQVAALTNVTGKGGFDIMQDEDTYKSIYDIMLGISKVWDQMTDVKQSALLELLAGKVRSNQVAALLNNMSRAEEILHTSENSQGTMQEVHERWLDSIAAKQAQMTASWEQLSQTVMSSDVIKGWYQVGSDILNIINGIVGGLGSAGTVLTGGGIAGLAGLFAKNGNGNILTGMMDAITNRGGTVQGKAIKEYNTALGEGANKLEAMTRAQKKLGEGTAMTKATRFAMEYSDGISNATDGMTIMQMKLQGIGSILKNVGANLLVSGLMAGVGWLADQGLKAFDRYANAEKYAVQAADDASANYQSAQNEVKALEDELAKLKQQYDELDRKGPLSFADQQTKADLKEQTAEMELQLEVQKQIAAEAGKVAYTTNKESWRQQYSMNGSLAFKLSNPGLAGDGRKLVSEAKETTQAYIDDMMGYAGENIDDVTKSIIKANANNSFGQVTDELNRYLKNGLVGNDLLGTVEMYKYLKDVRADAVEELEFWDKQDEETRRENEMYIERFRKMSSPKDSQGHDLINQVEGQLIKEYQQLAKNIAEMEAQGDTADMLYTEMRTAFEAIGRQIFPIIHTQNKVNELRKSDKDFDALCDELEELAKTSEITADTLNQQKFDGFRQALIEAGGDIDSFIDHLNSLRETPAPDNLTDTTATGLQTRITGMLDNRTKAMSIFKNTGYGANALSEEDYKTLKDMNDPDLLKAVKYDYGTTFFDMDTFSKVMSSKMSEQYDVMYKDMIAKQNDYVNESKKLATKLAEYQKMQNESVAKEEEADHQTKLRNAQEEIAAITKNMVGIQGEIDLYNRLGMQMKMAMSAYGRWQLAKGGPEEGDNYDEAMNALKALEEGFKSGRVGTAAYKAAQEYLLGPDGNYYGNAGQRSKLVRYLSKSNPDDKEGKDVGWGARNWQADAKKAGILNADGSFSANWSVEQIAEKMGVSVDLVEHMFGELNEFIADETKKYKFESKTVEMDAATQNANYEAYTEARKNYQQAVEAYNHDANAKTLQDLIDTGNKFTKAAEKAGLNKPDLREEAKDASESELTGAVTGNTGAVEENTGALGDVGGKIDTLAAQMEKESEKEGSEGEGGETAEGSEVPPATEGVAETPVVSEQMPDNVARAVETLQTFASEMETIEKSAKTGQPVPKRTISDEDYNQALATVKRYAEDHSEQEELIKEIEGLEYIKTKKEQPKAETKSANATYSPQEVREMAAYFNNRAGVTTPEGIEEYNRLLAQIKNTPEELIPSDYQNIFRQLKSLEPIVTGAAKTAEEAAKAAETKASDVKEHNAESAAQTPPPSAAAWSTGNQFEDFRNLAAYLNNPEAAKTAEQIDAYNQRLAAIKNLPDELIPDALKEGFKQLKALEPIVTGVAKTAEEAAKAAETVSADQTTPPPQEVDVKVEQEESSGQQPKLEHDTDSKGLVTAVQEVAEGWDEAQKSVDEYDQTLHEAQAELSKDTGVQAPAESDLLNAADTLRTYQAEMKAVNEAASQMKPLPGKTVTDQQYNRALSAIQNYVNTYGDPMGVFKDFMNMKPIEVPLAADKSELDNAIDETDGKKVTVELDAEDSKLKEKVDNATKGGATGGEGKGGSKAFTFAPASDKDKSGISYEGRWALMGKIANLRNVSSIINGADGAVTPDVIKSYNDRLQELQNTPEERIPDDLKADFEELRGLAPIVASAAEETSKSLDNVSDDVEIMFSPDGGKPENAPQKPIDTDREPPKFTMEDIAAQVKQNVAEALSETAEKAETSAQVSTGPAPTVPQPKAPEEQGTEEPTTPAADPVAKAIDEVGETIETVVAPVAQQQVQPEPVTVEQQTEATTPGTPTDTAKALKDAATASETAAKAMSDSARQGAEEERKESKTADTGSAQAWSTGNPYEDFRNMAAYFNNRSAITTPEAAKQYNQRLSTIQSIPDMQIPGDLLAGFNELRNMKPIEIPVTANTTAAQSAVNSVNGKTVTVNVDANVTQMQSKINNVANKTVTTTVQKNAEGTSNAAPGMSLVDEEGAELIEHVSRGTFELGTDNGPRFAQLDKGDIVHTAEDTKKIKRRGIIGRVFDAFRNGGVKGGRKFATGMSTRLQQLAAGADKEKSAQIVFAPAKTTVNVTKADTIYDANDRNQSYANDTGKQGTGTNLTPSNNTTTKTVSNGTGSGANNALKWAEKLVDWIPKALDLIKRKTQEYIKSAEKAVGYLARNRELTNAINNTNAEIELNEKAALRYERQAEEFGQRAGLTADIIRKIQQGTIDIEEYSDEKTRKAITTYQNWWEKAVACRDTIEELKDQLYDLSKQKLDNIVNYFGNIDDMLNQQIETYNKLNEVKEAYGQEMTRTDYLDAIKLTEEVINNLSEEQSTLQKELDDQVASGVIKAGSDDWYNYAKQIEELKRTISEAKINLSELNDEVKNITLGNLETSIYYLNNLQEKIEGIQKLREAQGSVGQVNEFRMLISNGMKQIANLEQQNQQIREQMAGLDTLSEKYQELYKQLQDNDGEILNIKASQEEWNDAIIDMKIEILEKQNDEYQRQLNLMKALNDLEDARQRKVLMYDNQQGYHYVADEDAMENATDAVNNQIYDLVINGLEKQKDNNNIYDAMGNELIPVTDMLAGIDFTQYYDSINRGTETSALLTNLLNNIDIPDLLSQTQGGDISIDIGDIILNGVNDAQSLGDAIIAQLPGYLVQAIYAKGS